MTLLKGSVIVNSCPHNIKSKLLSWHQRPSRTSLQKLRPGLVSCGLRAALLSSVPLFWPAEEAGRQTGGYLRAQTSTVLTYRAQESWPCCSAAELSHHTRWYHWGQRGQGMEMLSVSSVCSKLGRGQAPGRGGNGRVLVGGLKTGEAESAQGHMKPGRLAGRQWSGCC